METSTRYSVAPGDVVQLAVNPVEVIELAALADGATGNVVTVIVLEFTEVPETLPALTLY